MEKTDIEEAEEAEEVMEEKRQHLRILLANGGRRQRE